MSVPTFELQIRVAATDIDALNHVNNVVYVQYIQDIAVAHWESAAPDALRSNVVWVVRRHEIDYLRSAVLGDDLLVTTRAGKHTAATWERLCEIYRVSDNQLIVKSKSVWVALDANTHKLRRINDELLQIFKTKEE